jgi:hypothetical protein
MPPCHLVTRYPLRKYLTATLKPRPPSPTTFSLQTQYPNYLVSNFEYVYEERWYFDYRETTVYSHGDPQGYYLCARGDASHPRVEPTLDSPYFVAFPQYDEAKEGDPVKLDTPSPTPEAQESAPPAVPTPSTDSPSPQRKPKARPTIKRRPIKHKGYKSVSSIPVPKPCKPSWFK